MREVFVDTQFLVAALHPRDELHDKAIEEQQRVTRARLVTTEFVFVELHNFFAEYGEALRAAAARVVDEWSAKTSVVVVPAARVAFLKALERYKARADKGYSLTDCHSMLVMEDRGITEVLTYDEHFEQAGFRALLRSTS